MKIIKVDSGTALSALPEYAGNIVSDGFTHYYYDQTLMTCLLTPSLFIEFEKLVGAHQAAALEVTKEPVSITDLLALKTTFHTDDIIKLKENNLL